MDRPDGVVDPDGYHCPYCGERAPVDHWWTPQQLEFAGQAALKGASDQIGEALRDGLGHQPRNSLIRLEVSHESSTPPNPLVEPNDMTIVEPPCHPYEPMKVKEEWSEPIHCLVCGSEFAV